jgi:hypothetical protein
MVALATFVSALVGFGVQWLLPAGYVVESKGMVGSVVGLVASLLSLVLSLLIWTSHGLFTTQQSQLQTLGGSIVHLEFLLQVYGGSRAGQGRSLLLENAKGIRARLWDDTRKRRFTYHTDMPEDVRHMIAFFTSLHPTEEEQQRYLASAIELFSTIVETQVTMIRSLVNRVPFFLLAVVLGWSCVLFFGYGLLSAIDTLTIFLAALGAVCVGSAVFLILELSDPYIGLFRMSSEGFDGLIRTLAEGAKPDP